MQTAPGELGRFQCTAVASSVCSIQWRINRTLIIDSEADAYSIPARIGVGMLSSTLHVTTTVKLSAVLIVILEAKKFAPIL